MFDLLQFYTMDRLWYLGDTHQLKKVLSYYLDKVDTNPLVIKYNVKIRNLLELSIGFCSDFFNKYPEKSNAIQQNPTCSGKYSDAIKLAAYQESPRTSSRLGSADSQSSNSRDPRENRSSHSFHSRSPTKPDARIQTSSEEKYYNDRKGNHEKQYQKNLNFPVDASIYSFPGTEINTHRLPCHPFKNTNPLVGEMSDYLLVTIEAKTCGDGIINSELLEIGLQLPDGKKFFAPILPRKVNLSNEALERAGYFSKGEPSKRKSLSTRPTHFLHPSSKKSIQVLQQSEIIIDMVSFLEKSLRRTDLDGIIIVTFYRETLLVLMRCLHVMGQKICDQFLRIVKGFTFLEPIIRKSCLTNCDGDVRIPISIAAKIFDIKEHQLEVSDELCSTASEVMKKLDDLGYLKKSCQSMNLPLMNKMEAIFTELKKCNGLIEFITLELRKSRDLTFDGLFWPFPKSPKLLMLEDYVANFFVEMLVLNTMILNELKNIGKKHGGNELYQRIKSAIMRSIPQQRLKVIDSIDIAVVATVEWITQNNASDQESSRRKIETPTYDSESSMPEELPEKDDGFKEEEMMMLTLFLAKEFGTQTNKKYTKTCLENICRSMCKLWEKCGFGIDRLSKIFFDQSLTIDVREEIFLLSLNQKSDDKPLEWKGFSLVDMIETTEKYFKNRTPYKDREFLELENYFAEAVAKHINSGRSTELKPSDINTARSLTKAVEDIGYSYQSLMKKVSLANKETTLTQESLMFSLKRKYPSPQTQWSGFDTAFIINGVMEFFKAKQVKQEIRPEGISIIENQKSLEAKDDKRHFTPDEMDIWKSHYNGNELELDSLITFCDKIKYDTSMWQYTESKKIILDLLKLLDKNFLSLSGIKKTFQGRDDYGCELETMKICSKIFGEQRRQKKGKKEYVGTSDFDIYKNLLERFCEYIRKPNTRVEDRTEVLTVESPDDEYVENIESIEIIISELQKRYLGRKKCLPSFDQIHEHLYYNQSLNKMHSKEPTHVYVNDLVKHLAKCGNIETLKTKVVEIKNCNEKKDWHKLLANILNVGSFPSSCISKSGLLLNVFMEYFDHIANKVEFSDNTKKLDMIIDNTNELAELQQFIFWSYVEQASRMKESGELEDFSLSMVDVKELSTSVHRTVNFLLDNGFNLYEAIKLYIEGSLIEVLKKMIKKHEKSNPEANDHILLTRLTFDFIDTKLKLKRTPSLPQSKSHMNLLQLRVISLLNNGQLVKPEFQNKVKVTKMIPKSCKETLQTLNTSQENSNESSDDEVPMKEDYFFSPNNIPGNIVLSKVVVIPPKSVKNFYANVTGLPRLKKDSQIKIKALQDVERQYKVSIGNQKSILEIDRTIQITVKNNHENNVVNLSKGLIIAKAFVKDEASIVSSCNSPSYCLQFLKYYYKTYKLENIHQKNDFIVFGAELTTSFHKNQRTNFRIWGTNYCCGLLDYYTVEAVVYFLHQVKSSSDPYEDYLSLALSYNKPIVRHNDYYALYQYLHEDVGLCEEIDKDFTIEKDAELSKLYKQQFSTDEDLIIDELKNEDLSLEVTSNPEKNLKKKNKNPNIDLIYKLKEYLIYDYNLDIVQAGKEIKLLVAVLEDIGYSLCKVRLDFFACPKHRELFKDIFKRKIKEKMKDLGFDGAKEGNKMMEATMENLKVLSKPQTIKQMNIFTEFAMLFHNEVLGMENETLCGKLREQILGKKSTDSYCWDDELERIFESLKESISSITNLKPPTEEGEMKFYSAASENCLANLIVQEEEGIWHPIGYNSRSLSPHEQKLSKIEKNGIAIVWGLNINKHILLGSEFTLKVGSDELRRMFTPGNVNTADWSAQVDEFQYKIDLVEDNKNPATALTLENENKYKYHEKTVMIIDLFNHMLNVMKKSTKDRNRWQKFKMRTMKRSLQDKNSKSLGEVEAGNFDFDLSDMKDSSEPDTTNNSLKSKSRIHCGPTIDFIVASSSTIVSAKSGDIELPDTGESAKSFPECIVEEFQPLFEIYFSHLVGIKEIPRDISIDQANKTVTKLKVHGIEYTTLKNFVSKISSKNDEFSSGQLGNMIAAFLSQKGMNNIYCKELFLKSVVEHFKMALNLRQKIKINLKMTAPKAECEPSVDCQTAAFLVEEKDDSIAASDSDEEREKMVAEPLEHPGWFLDLLESDMDSNQTNQRTNWSSKIIVGSQNQTGIVEKINDKQTSGSFEQLEDYYNKLIKALPTEERKKFRCDKVGGHVLCKCWVIAQLDYKALQKLYKQNIEKGRHAVLNKLDTSLCTYRVLLPKGVNISLLSKWTFRYFKTLDNKIGCFHSLYQRKAILRLQKENIEENDFDDIKNFFHRVMIQCHNRNIEEAQDIASSCVLTFELCGFSFETLKILFTTATYIPTCLESLFSGLMFMFENISCLLPQTVDIERLINYTLVYFKAGQEIEYQTASETDQNSDNLTTLLPLILHCSQVISGDLARNNVENVGNIVVKDQVIILPEETETTNGKISWTSKKLPIIGTPLQMETHDFVKVAHKDVDVVPTNWLYSGTDVKVSLKNRNKVTTSALGNPGRVLYVADVKLMPPDSEKVRKVCESSARFLSDNNIDISKLATLYQNVVKTTVGCKKSISRVALEHAIIKLAKDKNVGIDDRFVFELFMHQTVLYSRKLKINPTTETKENLKETIEPKSLEDMEIEEGECLSDDDDEEPEVKLNEKIPEGENEEEEVDIGGMLSFHGNTFTEEQIMNISNDITVPVDLIKLIKTNIQHIDFDTKVDNSVIVNNYLIEVDTMIDFYDGISYNFESVAYFVKNMLQPHPVYIKKVSALNPNIRLVHMDHRKILIDSFSSENFEKVENLQVLSCEAKMQRLLRQYKRIFSKMKTVQGSLPQTKYTDFQPLFEKYFMSIYLSGFKCQENWLEVSRVAAEELVNCWLSADFQYTHLLRNMTTLRARHGLTEKKKKEKYRKLFR